MTGLDIEAIRAEFERARTDQVAPVSRLAQLGGQRVPELCDEVMRLRAELLEEQTVHAKTFDNFEAHVESCMEERTRQLDRYARLDAAHDRLKKEHDDLKQFCAALTEARDEARENYQDVCDQLRDERAEVRKLREWNGEIKAERDALAQRALHHESELREAGDELRGLTAEHDRLVAELRTAREGR